jgi:hypothetical protein
MERVEGGWARGAVAAVSEDDAIGGPVLPFDRFVGPPANHVNVRRPGPDRQEVLLVDRGAARVPHVRVEERRLLRLERPDHLVPRACEHRKLAAWRLRRREEHDEHATLGRDAHHLLRKVAIDLLSLSDHFGPVLVDVDSLAVEGRLAATGNVVQVDEAGDFPVDVGWDAAAVQRCDAINEVGRRDVTVLPKVVALLVSAE